MATRRTVIEVRITDEVGPDVYYVVTVDGVTHYAGYVASTAAEHVRMAEEDAFALPLPADGES